MREILDQLLDNARIWQASRHQQVLGAAAESTGFAALDAQLPGGGWPRGALIECLTPAPGIGELRLLLPALCRLSRAGQTVFWIDPPHTPYAPALARAQVELNQVVSMQTQSREDRLWALENCLRSHTTGLAMIWLDTARRSDIRRIQLAAEAGDNLCVLFRDARYADQSSPAALRLQLTPLANGQLQANILKRRGGWPVDGLTLPLAPVAPAQDAEALPGNVIRGPWPQPH
ncbi:translesion DNA synthesis-associated protein ImuA [Marinobacter sp. JSM 1782161]|uniref:translesion DNA synthesis-associated protein ImuA n=1 Tax=Marinobacter sp. JSM 1782161 TaxID=2685906 RepID=UPI0014038F48|nr:translesion DNA synthesis-associated protein ImuA [Marinobacter sp. JSM 1782161]